MQRQALLLAAAIPLAACTVTPETEFVPTRKSAVELRSMQVRIVDTDADTTMRSVIATLHDLGYRITRVEPEAMTVSATRQTALRMAVIVQPREAGQSTVRANASLVSLFREAQVDSPDFYQRNFFIPLGETIGRAPIAVAEGEATPDAVRPVAEVNTAREREAAAARAPAKPVTTSALATGSSIP